MGLPLLALDIFLILIDDLHFPAVLPIGLLLSFFRASLFLAVFLVALHVLGGEDFNGCEVVDVGRTTEIMLRRGVASLSHGRVAVGRGVSGR